MRKLKIAEERANKFESKFRDLEAAHTPMVCKVQTLERQKQLDDMAISGLKSIKEDSSNAIVKLNQKINTLKLDLLAERVIRRKQQTSLHEFDPQNEDYNIASIDSDDPIVAAAVANGSGDIIRPLRLSTKSVMKTPVDLNCEAPPAPSNQPISSQVKLYVVPSKIQKAGTDNQRDKFQLYKTQRSAWNKGDKKCSGFEFVAPLAPSEAGPSTATTSSSIASNHKFGIGTFKPMFPPSTKSSTGITANFKFTSNTLDFSTAAAGPIVFGPSTTETTTPTTPSNTNMQQPQFSFGLTPPRPNSLYTFTPFGPKSSDR